MKHVNVYKVTPNADNTSLRRASDDAYMSKNGITKDSHTELDWGYTDGSYSAVTTEWR